MRGMHWRAESWLPESRVRGKYGRAARIAYYDELKSTPTKRD